MPAVAFEDLFDAEFLRSVHRLRLVARRVDVAGRFAEQRSRDLGGGIEFRDFRPYTPGDDFRAIDWNIYQRLGRVFLRLFEELEDLPLLLVPDVSRSAFLESPPRARAGLRACLALGAVSLGQHDSVGLFPFSDDLRVVQRPKAGRTALHPLAQRLAALEPGGTTDLGRSLTRLTRMRLRRGLVVIVSDFFDPAGLDALDAALGRMRHRVVLVQLTRASDRDPTLAGDVRLVDCESGATEDVSITGDVLRRYREAYDAFADQLSEIALRRQAGLVRLDVEQPVVPQLARLFEGGRFTA